jgi:RNA polymerase sigma-70 factor (ECF subfamily)
MYPQELSAQELVQLCLDHNQKAAWEEFVRRYQPPIACAVRKSARHWVTPTPALVDDLVQDTYLKLFANDFRALREFDFQHENAVFGFLKTVASRVVIDHFRGEWNDKRGGGQETFSLDDVATFVPSSRSSAQKADREITIHEVDDILKSQASEPNFVRDYCIFWLYYRHGFTAKAISELPGVGLMVKGVESTLLRLTRLVRSRMGRGAWG